MKKVKAKIKSKVKQKTKSKKAASRKIAPGKTILYLHVMQGTKKWLTALSRKQVGRSTQSAMAEKILTAVKKNPKFLASAFIDA
jgi:hypothetical protein